jgi:KUP system potassium uptake protein
MTEQPAEHVISEQPDRLQGGASPPEKAERGLVLVSLTALGVVYGDIGTSPLYAMRKCFHGDAAVPPSPDNVLGVLSLVLWSLLIVVSVKYVLYVMRADNRGEGGILALLALVTQWRQSLQRGPWALMAIGVFGAALLYGDGMITPAISVLSAVEGLEVATPAFRAWVVPITVAILMLLFWFQRRGTGQVGSTFGPVMMVWFLLLAVLGLAGIVQKPGVLAAANPLYGARFLLANHWQGFQTLGAVFLVVTGAEALYADMGHFGKGPIRYAWFVVVLPALLLNYYGQGALLLADPGAARQPFFLLAPPWALYPLVAIATAATIIASQAVISAVFSLTRQAVLLGLFPRLRILQTSPSKIGQVYMPTANWLLLAATIALVVGFRRSANLAGAYGVAVSTTMVITTLLAGVLARKRWKWSLPAALAVSACLLAVDVPFWAANLLKVPAGGWVPLLVAGLAFLTMSTWRWGHAALERSIDAQIRPLNTFLECVAKDPPARVPGTSVYLTGHTRETPEALEHHLRHNHILHERVVLLTILFEDVPRVWPGDRLEVEMLSGGFSRVLMHIGYMEDPNVPAFLRADGRLGLAAEPIACTYCVGHITMVSDPNVRPLRSWRDHLFAFMMRNAVDPIAFFHLPPDQVLEIGLRVQLDHGSRMRRRDA